MDVTHTAPNVPIASFKRTKIIATLGPSTDGYDMIRRLIDSGVNGIRLNCSHGSNDERREHIPLVRRASQELGKPVAIILDLQGPKIRLGDFEGIIQVKAGQDLVFGLRADYASTGVIPTQYDLSQKIKPGERLYLFDGRVRTTVMAIDDDQVHAHADNDGMLIKRKGMNLPDTDFGGDILTEKDMTDIEFGVTQDIDYVALSFVQTADDIHNLRRILQERHCDAKIIAKIETKAAVTDENIEAIVEAADAVMVARGDLAVETPSESVPVVQRRLIGLCLKHSKLSIVATQMLLSMVDNPEPTRAEVSDVATAAFLGADCVMLSDETAMGKYPLETVQAMKRIVLYAEQHPPLKTAYPFESEHTLQQAISGSILSMARDIQATAIVAETKTGATALQIASRRPESPLIAVTSELRTAQQLALVCGIKSYVREVEPDVATKLTDWLRESDILKSGDIIIYVSGRHPGVAGGTDTIKVRVLE